MNPARPWLETAEVLKLPPLLGIFKDVDVRFGVGRGLVALQFLGDNPIMKLGFDRDRSRDVTVNEMINEMLGLSVFPLAGLDAKRDLAERVGIALAELRKLNFSQRTGFVELCDGSRDLQDRQREAGAEDRHPKVAAASRVRGGTRSPSALLIIIAPKARQFNIELGELDPPRPAIFFARCGACILSGGVSARFWQGRYRFLFP